MDAIRPLSEEFVADEIPLSKDEPVWVFLYLFISGFVAVALFNIIEWQSTPVVGLIASLFWLLLVFTTVAGSCVYEGPLLTFVNFLGMLAARQFVQIQRNPEDLPLVCFGYRLCGLSFYYLKIYAREIASVEWDTGQASAMVGRDMDDWHVFLWYDTKRLGKRPTYDDRRKGQWIYGVGGSGPKQKTDEFGRQFVDFLGRAGAELVSADDGRKYERRD